MSYYDEIRLQEEAKRCKLELDHQKEIAGIYEAEAKRYLKIIEKSNELIDVLMAENKRLKEETNDSARLQN